jgi:hypothetical protein
VDLGNKPRLEFSQDGRLRAAELIIVNLRPGHGAATNSRVWEQVSSKAVLSKKSIAASCLVDRGRFFSKLLI